MAPDMDCISPTLLKEGYLKKPKKWSKRYFVIREGPPACLEYYDSHKRKGNGKPKRVIPLEHPWSIHKKALSKQKYLVAIYTETEYFSMAADNENDQANWVNALRLAALGSRAYHAMSHVLYQNIWHGHVETKELDGCDPVKKENLQGSHRCCLTERSLVFVRVNSTGGCNVPAHDSVEVVIAGIRSCGHKENVFFMEPGRSCGIGTGRLSMELEDSTIADNMHKTILALWNITTNGNGETRPRATSLSNRTRHYYCPPPSQVGLGKSALGHVAKTSQRPEQDPRTRCGSMPTKSKKHLEETRDRASSEGSQSMKQIRPGYKSGMSRLAKRSSTRSLTPSSGASSNSSSRERVNTPLYLPISKTNGHDEYVDVNPVNVNIPFRYDVDLSFEHDSKENSSGAPSVQSSSHSRTHSLDDNYSFAAPMSSASSSVDGQADYTGTSPSRCTCGGMRHPADDPAPDYTFMNPASVRAEDKDGYVPMGPLTRSQPQEIASRRRSLSEKMVTSAGHSPVSPNRSPGKYPHLRRMRATEKGLSNSYPVNRLPRTRTASSHANTWHGMRDTTNHDNVPDHFSQSRHAVRPSILDASSDSTEYLPMGDFPRTVSNINGSRDSEVYHDYLPMSPMNSGSNVVVGNVLSVARCDSVGVSQPTRYPHQRSGVHTHTNSLERSSKLPRRNTLSAGISLPWRGPRTVKRSMTRVDSQSVVKTVSVSDPAKLPPVSQPGGEYVMIDLNKAKKQVGPDYVSLVTESADPYLCFDQVDNRRKMTRDSNGNILPPQVDNAAKDEDEY